MNRLTIVLTVVVLAACLANAGCDAGKTKEDLATISAQYNDLQKAHQAAQTDLMKAEARNGELQSDLNKTTADLATANAKLAALTGGAGGGPEPPEDWQKTKTGAKLTLASDVLFRPGRANLSTKGQAKLRQAATAIKTTYPKAVVRVYGYCDGDPIKRSAKLWKDNLDLSSNRAMAVTRQLRKLGVAPEQIETVGMGSTNPIASNKTKAGKAKNRRVEIVVVLRG